VRIIDKANYSQASPHPIARVVRRQLCRMS
jgi:hypothetical protein